MSIINVILDLDWRDVIAQHRVDIVYGQPSLKTINNMVKKLSDGALNIYIEKDKKLWEY